MVEVRFLCTVEHDGVSEAYGKSVSDSVELSHPSDDSESSETSDTSDTSETSPSFNLRFVNAIRLNLETASFSASERQSSH